MATARFNPGRNIALAFIDGSLPDLQTILTGLDPSVTAIVLDPAQDGIQQMTDALDGMSGLDAIHIISHGSSGLINLGAAQLSQDTLAQYQTQLTTIGNALSATGDLLLYGCNVAQGNVGQAFISALASATGADVAASTDVTGALGGNWVLEANTGAIEATLPLDANVQANYVSTLGISSNSNYDPNLAIDMAQLSLAAYHTGDIPAVTSELQSDGWVYVGSASDHTYRTPLDIAVDAQAFVAKRTIDGNVESVVSGLIK